MSNSSSEFMQTKEPLNNFLEEMRRELFFEMQHKSEYYNFEFSRERPSDQINRFVWEESN